MNTGILIGRADGSRKNIGDYIQSIAETVFFPEYSEYVEREELSDYADAEKTRLIMNGWFMWHPEKWPPSADIEPLIISFHMNPTAAKKMLSTDGVNYLKAHAPIGCRDTNTLSLVKEKGIPAYFSGCLTLCLGEIYKRKQIDPRKLIFVDPYCEAFRNDESKFSVGLLVSSAVYGLLHLKDIKKLFSKFQYNGNDKHKRFYAIRQYLYVSAFLKTYSKSIDKDLLFDAEYISHSVYQADYPLIEDKFRYADELLKKYSTASLIITSRIHCALPCLGIETPVLFVSSKRLESDDPSKVLYGTGRLDGLSDLFLCARCDHASLVLPPQFQNAKISYENLGQYHNKADYLCLKELLMKKCKEFVTNTGNIR